MKLYFSMEKEKNSQGRGLLIFYIILVGQCISYIGSGLMCFAQIVWVYTDLGGTISQLALIAVFTHLPGILLSPLAGAIADRFNRRIIMIISDAVAALATLSLHILIMSQTFSLWHLYIIATVIGIANRFQWPAYLATVSQLVPKKHIGRANGLIAVTRSIGSISAPALAGFLVTAFSISGVILFDMTTFCIAFFTLLFIRFPKYLKIETDNEKGKIKVLNEIISGFKYIKGKQGLVGIILIIGIGSLASGVFAPMRIPLILQVTSRTLGGIIFSIGAIGTVLGGVIISFWGGPKKKILGLIVSLFSLGLSLIIAGISPFLLFLGIGLFFYGVSVPFREACAYSIIHKKVPQYIQGRILALIFMITQFFLHIGMLIPGPIVDHIFNPGLMPGGFLSNTIGLIIGTGEGKGVVLMIIILGVICSVSAVIFFLNKRVRYVEIELKDSDMNTNMDTVSGMSLSNDPVMDESL